MKEVAAAVNDLHNVPPLTFGELRFEASTRIRKRLFGRRAKTLPMVTMSAPGHTIEFDYAEVMALADRPILIEVVSSKPQGDYFLVSPRLIEPSSAMASSLDEQHFADDSLLILHGLKILAEVSATQQIELIAWLQGMSEPQ